MSAWPQHHQSLSPNWLLLFLLYLTVTRMIILWLSLLLCLYSVPNVLNFIAIIFGDTGIFSMQSQEMPELKWWNIFLENVSMFLYEMSNKILQQTNSDNSSWCVLEDKFYHFLMLLLHVFHLCNIILFFFSFIQIHGIIWKQTDLLPWSHESFLTLFDMSTGSLYWGYKRKIESRIKLTRL